MIVAAAALALSILPSNSVVSPHATLGLQIRLTNVAKRSVDVGELWTSLRIRVELVDIASGKTTQLEPRLGLTLAPPPVQTIGPGSSIGYGNGGYVAPDVPGLYRLHAVAESDAESIASDTADLTVSGGPWCNDAPPVKSDTNSTGGALAVVLHSPQLAFFSGGGAGLCATTINRTGTSVLNAGLSFLDLTIVDVASGRTIARPRPPIGKPGEVPAELAVYGEPLAASAQTTSYIALDDAYPGLPPGDYRVQARGSNLLEIHIEPASHPARLQLVGPPSVTPLNAPLFVEVRMWGSPQVGPWTWPPSDPGNYRAVIRREGSDDRLPTFGGQAGRVSDPLWNATIADGSFAGARINLRDYIDFPGPGTYRVALNSRSTGGTTNTIVVRVGPADAPHVAYELSLDRESYESGQAIEVTCAVHNLGTSIVGAWANACGFPAMTDASHKPVRLPTPTVDVFDISLHPIAVGGSYQERTEFKTYRSVLGGTVLAPGVYELSYHRTLRSSSGAPIDVTSDPVLVSIASPPGTPLAQAIAVRAIPDWMVDADIDAGIPAERRAYVRKALLSLPPDKRGDIAGYDKNGRFFSNRLAAYSDIARMQREDLTKIPAAVDPAIVGEWSCIDALDPRGSMALIYRADGTGSEGGRAAWFGTDGTYVYSRETTSGVGREFYTIAGSMLHKTNAGYWHDEHWTPIPTVQDLHCRRVTRAGKR